MSGRCCYRPLMLQILQNLPYHVNNAVKHPGPKPESGALDGGRQGAHHGPSYLRSDYLPGGLNCD